MKKSNTVEKIFKDGVGYRCESISSGRHKPSDVVRFEVEELGNDNKLALAQYCDGLKLLRRNCSFKSIYETLKKEYDGAYDALWLTTKDFAKKRYCDSGEKPMGYAVPKNSMVIQDLDEDGGLFLIKG